MATTTISGAPLLPSGAVSSFTWFPWRLAPQAYGLAVWVTARIEAMRMRNVTEPTRLDAAENGMHVADDESLIPGSDARGDENGDGFSVQSE